MVKSITITKALNLINSIHIELNDAIAWCMHNFFVAGISNSWIRNLLFDTPSLLARLIIHGVIFKIMSERDTMYDTFGLISAINVSDLV